MKNLALALILALGAFSALPASAGERTVKITATNFAFAPGTITLKLHQHVKLHFVGKQGMHGIIIPDLGVNNVVNIGAQPVDVEVTPSKTGTFTAHCAVFCGAGHAAMILTIKVVK
ncbi:MAG: cupredoxin domain-containing protein [Candidatus Eremiobacteraeota bacterium]|nr:cupredoxin domain-containing protein [Candidatus Eremiobacteraeota bacterium]